MNRKINTEISRGMTQGHCNKSWWEFFEIPEGQLLLLEFKSRSGHSSPRKIEVIKEMIKEHTIKIFLIRLITGAYS